MDITKSEVCKIISNHCQSLNIKFKDNYVCDFKDNLIDDYPEWKIIVEEIKKGGGGEFNGAKPKFNAIHSSAALCVNNFALIKQNHNSFTFLGEENFDFAVFEKKLSTGISNPYLDFYLTNKNSIFAFESKYTEIIDSKLPNWIDSKTEIGNLQKYKNRRKSLRVSNDFIDEILQYYIDYDRKMFLDVAQLIKHLFGIMNIQNNLKKTLVYIYWRPLDYEKFDNYIQHEEELIEFKSKMLKYKYLVEFQSISYSDFWNQIVKDNSWLENDFEKVKERYNLRLSLL